MKLSPLFPDQDPARCEMSTGTIGAKFPTHPTDSSRKNCDLTYELSHARVTSILIAGKFSMLYKTNRPH